MSALPTLTTLTLQEKIKAAEDIITKAYCENDGHIFISFSGGKDSTVLLHIARRLFPDIQAVFSNTTNEHKEILDYVKTFDNIITVFPKMNFKSVVAKYGYPAISKEVSQKVNELKHTNGRTTRNTRFKGDKKGNGKLPNKYRWISEQPFDLTNKCCDILKKNPLKSWASKRGLKPVIALMKDESRLRSQLALYGKEDNKKIYPFLRTGFTEEDVFEYARINQIRFAECYYTRIINGIIVKPLQRTGCAFCAFGINLETEDRFERLAIVSPKRYESMMRIENGGATFKDVIGMVKGKSRTPKFDLYGMKPTKERVLDNGLEFVEMKSTVKTRICPRCESRNVKKAFGHMRSYPDTPNPTTGKMRRFLIEGDGYDCLDCKMPTTDNIHMVNTEFGVTDRLVEYIYKNLSKKSSHDIIQETGISVEVLWDILQAYDKIKEEVA